MSKWLASVLLLGLPFFHGCGGDEVEEKTDEASKTEAPPTTPEEPLEPVEEVFVVEPEPLDPNGVYLETGEVLNGRAVYKAADGFYLWFDGNKWNLSDQKGGGRVISSSRGEDINDRWSSGSAVNHPEPDMLKDAKFRLAVAYQGTSDYANAYNMFDDFSKKYPEDKLTPQCYLSLGDIVISRIPSDVQPTFAQIAESRAHYAKVRELSPRDAKLVNDATFNEGDLLERIAGNPEGIVDATWNIADKDEDGALSKTEYGGVEQFRGISYADANLDGDEKVDYAEVFDLFSLIFYKQMGELFEQYKLANANLEGAELSRATHKVGIAYEKQGRPEDMLREYYGAITDNDNKLGNDPSSVGIDEILKVYSKKYEQYHKQYTRTLALLDALESPDQEVKFSVTTRAGPKDIETTVKEALGKRAYLIHWLNIVYAGMDLKARTDVVNFRTSIKQNWINATRTRFKKRLAKFPSDLAPKEKFGTLYQNAARQGQQTLAFRMRWILDELGAGVKDGYSPNKNDFGAASPSVLLWMARTSIKQGNSETATVGLQRLVSMFSDSGEFVFDALVLLGDIQFKNGNFRPAEQFFSQGYTNFAWHPRASEALLKLGDARFRIGKKVGGTDGNEKLIEAEEAFSSVMENDELDMHVRAEAMFKMGECRYARRRFLDATDYYRQVYNGFPGAVDWAGKAFDQAIDCFDRLTDPESVAKLNIQKEKWARKFNAN